MDPLISTIGTEFLLTWLGLNPDRSLLIVPTGTWEDTDSRVVAYHFGLCFIIYLIWLSRSKFITTLCYFAILLVSFVCMSYLVVDFNDRWPQCFLKMLCHGLSVPLMIAVKESMALRNLLLSKPMVRAARDDSYTFLSIKGSVWPNSSFLVSLLSFLISVDYIPPYLDLD